MNPHPIHYTHYHDLTHTPLTRTCRNQPGGPLRHLRLWTTHTALPTLRTHLLCPLGHHHWAPSTLHGTTHTTTTTSTTCTDCLTTQKGTTVTTPNTDLHILANELTTQATYHPATDFGEPLCVTIGGILVSLRTTPTKDGHLALTISTDYDDTHPALINHNDTVTTIVTIGEGDPTTHN